MIRDVRSLKDYVAGINICIQRKFYDYSVVPITHLCGVNLEKTRTSAKAVTRMFSISIVLTLPVVQPAMPSSQSSKHEHPLAPASQKGGMKNHTK